VLVYQDYNIDYNKAAHLYLFVVRLEIRFMFIECFRRKLCNSGSGDVPIYVNVDMENGRMLNTWVDSLSASFAAVQVQHF
jgi:hypothetical protein